MRLLAFDTSGPWCTAALWDDGLRHVQHEDMARGQAERLMPLVAEVLAAGHRDYRDLDALAVGLGPGNFTGIRIGVAAARGLALGLGVPCFGVSRFEALSAGHGIEVLSVAAPRDQVYLQAMRDGLALGAPVSTVPAAAANALGSVLARLVSCGNARVGAGADTALTVRGADAGQSADALGGTTGPASDDSDLAAAIARVAAARWEAGDRAPQRPAPLYVRPADAAPPRERPPTILPG